jgi:excisionase family DNA binding protein
MSTVSLDHPLMRKRDACAFLGCSVSTLDRWVREGRIRSTKIGRGVRFTLSDLAAAIDRGRTQSHSKEGSNTDDSTTATAAATAG